MPLEIGTRLAYYEVTALIGEGGLGQVYQATDTKHKASTTNEFDDGLSCDLASAGAIPTLLQLTDSQDVGLEFAGNLPRQVAGCAPATGQGRGAARSRRRPTGRRQ